jgi:hypothetical protein
MLSIYTRCSPSVHSVVITHTLPLLLLYPRLPSTSTQVELGIETTTIAYDWESELALVFFLSAAQVTRHCFRQSCD